MRPEGGTAKVAVVDYGLGNLFSVKHACHHAGLEAVISSSVREIEKADGVILPGVGSFGDAMASLRRLDLVSPLRDAAASRKPLVGICLGMQLLLSESYTSGRNRGLGIIQGEVVRIENEKTGGPATKVPHVGWNRILAQAGGMSDRISPRGEPWEGTLLSGLREGEFMYFVHSYYPLPADEGLVLSVTPYGGMRFCSSLRKGNVFASQFHPERSGPRGLQIYRNLAEMIEESKEKRRKSV